MASRLTKFKGGLLVNGDCIQNMERLKKGSVDLVFADPPFGINYKYDQCKDNLTSEAYEAWTRTWITRALWCLKDTGSIFVAIGDEHAATVKRTLDICFFRNWIVWEYTFGTYCKSKFGRCHAHILYYTKDPKRFAFNADEIRVPSARQLAYNDKRANPKGKIPGDVWKFPRVCGTFKERTGHPCQMPVKLLKRIVKVASNKGDLVLDPFAGSGTTLAAAKSLGRRFVGIELSTNYCTMIEKRLNALSL